MQRADRTGQRGFSTDGHLTMAHDTLVLSNRMLRAQRRKRVRARTDLLPCELDSPIPLPVAGMKPNHPDYDYPILIGTFRNTQTGQTVEIPITYDLRSRIKEQEMEKFDRAMPTKWQRRLYEQQMDKNYTEEIKHARCDERRRA